jgi:hypothetical protein
MLTIRRDERGFLEVKEDIIGFASTLTTFWYYDTERWLVSIFGQQDDEPTQPMIPKQIDWVKTYFLPQLEKQHADTK